MALFNRQNNSDIPPELQPYYDAPPAPRKNWLSWIVRVIAFIILAAVIVVLVRWSWHEARGSGKDTAPGTSTSQSSPKKSTGSSSQGKVGSSDGSQTSGGAAKDSGSSSAATPSASSDSASSSSQPTAKAPAAAPPAPTIPAATATPTQTTLTNTGPGSMLSLVAAAVLGGVALYQYKLRAKLKD